MIALDARPELAARASLRSRRSPSGSDCEVVEAEAAVETNGTVSTPEAWTGESLWSGSALKLAAGAARDLRHRRRRRATLGRAGRLVGLRAIGSTSRWTSEERPLGIAGRGGARRRGSRRPTACCCRICCTLPVQREAHDRPRRRHGAARCSWTTCWSGRSSRASCSPATGGTTELVHSSSLDAAADHGRSRRRARDRRRVRRVAARRCAATTSAVRGRSPVPSGGIRDRHRLTATRCGRSLLGPAAPPCPISASRVLRVVAGWCT